MLYIYVIFYFLDLLDPKSMQSMSFSLETQVMKKAVSLNFGTFSCWHWFGLHSELCRRDATLNKILPIVLRILCPQGVAVTPAA